MPEFPYVVYVAGPNPDQQQKFVLAEEPPPEPTATAYIVISDGTRSAMLDPAGGEVLEDYVDPWDQFIQRCIRCTHDDLPGWTFWYRPDADGSREEWVIELGDTREIHPANSAAYGIQVHDLQGGVHDVSLSTHNWFGRWRWESAPRPVRATYDYLRQHGLLPYYDPSQVRVPGIDTVPGYEPMSLCGLPADEGQTGAYPGIGPNTGWQVQHIMRGAPESSFRNHGEAAGTMQWCVRDPVSHAPVDIVNQYPNASFYGGKGNPQLYKTGPTQPDNGHLPSIAYAAYLLTGDVYHLEHMQFMANYMLLKNPPDGRFYFAGRYVAWPGRALGECYLGMVPGHTYPSWLLPRDYWKHWLDYVRDQLNSRARDKTDPFYYLFHTVPEWGQASDKDPSKTGDHVWQQGMLCWMACWLAQSLDDWVEAAEWLLGGQIARCSPTSGWARSHPAPYHLRMRCASVLAAELSASGTVLQMQYQDTFMPGETVLIDSEQILLESTQDYLTWNIQRHRNGTAAAVHPAKRVIYGRKFTSWCEAKASNALVYGWTDTDADMPPSNFDPTYPSYMRTALAQGINAGLEVPGLVEAYQWIDDMMRTRSSAQVYDCWSVSMFPGPIGRRGPKLHWDTDAQHNPLVDEYFDNAETRGEDG